MKTADPDTVLLHIKLFSLFCLFLQKVTHYIQLFTHSKKIWKRNHLNNVNLVQDICGVKCDPRSWFLTKLNLGLMEIGHRYICNSGDGYGNSYGESRWKGLSDLILLSVVCIVIYAIYKTCIDSQVILFFCMHHDILLDFVFDQLNILRDHKRVLYG